MGISTCRAALVLLPGLLAACGGPSDATPPAPEPASPPAKAPTPAPPPRPPVVFVDVAAEAGLAVANHSGEAGKKPWLAGTVGGGPIVLDYDQDGRMDLVVVDGAMITDAGERAYDPACRTRVFHNDGGMKFTDVTGKSGVDLVAFGVGGASCDYDADGFPDFYVCCWGRNRLYRNRGDGTFEEVAEKAGVARGDEDFSTGCCFGDVDGDGVHDLFVVGYADQSEYVRRVREGAVRQSTYWHGIQVFRGPLGLVAETDMLFLGNGDGTFRDATATHMGPEPPKGWGFQPVMSDLDDDGDLDVYVPNDVGPNFLWVNDGKGRFAERGIGAGCAFNAAAHEQASMGVDVADWNRDGRLDLIVTNFSHDHNTLYAGRADARLSFDDVSSPANVARPSWNRVSWGVKFLDYDCDGELDLFIACGHVYPDVDKFPAVGARYKERCLLQRNVGPPSYAFVDATDEGGPALALERCWRGAAFADFDDDGDVDVFVTALNDEAALFRNDGGNRNAFLSVRVVGEGGQRDPSGARVTVFLADGKPRVEELHHGISFCGDNDPRLFFGLGAENGAKRVEVRRPGGTIQVFENVSARAHYVAVPGEAALRAGSR